MTNPSMIDFRIHVITTGSDAGAREVFQRMLSALIGAEYPTATDIRPDPGDWGIDVMVGSLAGSVLIWQSKYFYESIGDSQKRQIVDSLNSAMKNANLHGYRVDAWTLCVACELSGKEKQWWDKKVREWKKMHPGVQFDLWDAPRLRRKLMSPDAHQVWKEFYGPSKDHQILAGDASAIKAEQLPSLASRDETPAYEESLFVLQMQNAGIVELDAQRYAYFNADLVARDIAARGVAEQVSAIEDVDAKLHNAWELAFTDPATAPNSDEYESSARVLYTSVMREASGVQASEALPLRAVHTTGLMHHIVDARRAGWVHDWREVARLHSAHLEVSGTGDAKNQTERSTNGSEP